MAAQDEPLEMASSGAAPDEAPVGIVATTGGPSDDGPVDDPALGAPDTRADDDGDDDGSPDVVIPGLGEASSPPNTGADPDAAAAAQAPDVDTAAELPREAASPETPSPEDDEASALDVGAVVAAASKALASGAGVEAGRAVFDEAVFACEDEIIAEDPDDASAAKVAELWVAYARFERSLKQFKRAVQVFESATASPVAARDPTLWLEYAAFCTDRGKFENAKAVYARAVEALDDERSEHVWQAYVDLVRKLGDESATKESLQLAAAAAAAASEEEDHLRSGSPGPGAAPSSGGSDAAAAGAGGPPGPDEKNDGATTSGLAVVVQGGSGEAAAPGTKRAAADSTEQQEPATTESLEASSAKRARTTKDASKAGDDGAEQPSQLGGGPGELRMVFGREALTPDDVDADVALDPAQTQAFVAFAREPTAVEIVEALRLTDLLATAEIEETWAAVREHQANRLRAAVHDARLTERVVAAIRQENAQLQKRTRTELERLNADIQAALVRAGLPLAEVTADTDKIDQQRRVVRAVLAANLRAHRRQRAAATSRL